MNNKKWIFIFLLLFVPSFSYAWEVIYCPSDSVINNWTSCSSWITWLEFQTLNPSWNMSIWKGKTNIIEIDWNHDFLDTTNKNLIWFWKETIINIEWIENVYANQINMNVWAYNFANINIQWIYLEKSKQINMNVWVWKFINQNISGPISSISKQLQMNIWSNTTWIKSALQKFLVDNDISVQNRDFLTYFANWNNSEKTTKWFKEITVCWKDLKSSQNSCRVYYVWLSENLEWNYWFIIKIIDSWINETSEIYPTKLNNTETLYCVKNTTTCYVFNDIKKTITNQTLTSIPLSNIISHDNSLIYIKSDKSLSINNLINITGDKSKLIKLGNVLYIFDNDKVISYDLLNSVFISQQSMSFPKEFVEVNDWIVIYWENMHFYKIDWTWTINKINFWKEITTNLVYDLNSNEVVFCEMNHCYRLEANEYKFKTKENLITNYQNKKQIIVPIDRMGKTEYIIFD